jgi:hypothetical protein
MQGSGPNKRLDILTRQLTGAAVDEPALLQQDGQSGLDRMCPKALQALLVHDNGQLRQSIYDFLRVRGLCSCSMPRVGVRTAAWRSHQPVQQQR